MASFLYSLCLSFFFPSQIPAECGFSNFVLTTLPCSFYTSSLYISSKSLQQHFRWSFWFQTVPYASNLNISLHTALPKMLHIQFAFLLKHYMACSCETCHQATLLRALVRPAGFCVCILSRSGWCSGLSSWPYVTGSHDPARGVLPSHSELCCSLNYYLLLSGALVCKLFWVTEPMGNVKKTMNSST